MSSHSVSHAGVDEPLPIPPYPQRPGSSSARCRARYNSALAVHQYVKNAVIATNLLRFPPSSTRRRDGANVPQINSATRASSPHSFHVERSHRYMFDAAAYFHEACRHDGGGIVDASFDSYLGVTAPPVPIDAARVALPEHAGTVLLTSLLPPALLALFTPHLESLVPPLRAPAAATPIRDYAQYTALIRRMHAAGMVDFSHRPPAMRQRHVRYSQRRVTLSGLFSMRGLLTHTCAHRLGLLCQLPT